MPALRARLASAILVALITTLTSLVAVGATAAGEGESVTLAASRTGDRWAYDILVGDGWVSGEEDPVQPDTLSHAFAFSLGEDEVRLADLALHDAARLDVEGYSYWYSPEYSNRSWHDMKRSDWLGADGLLAAEDRGGSGSATASGGLGLPVGDPLFEQSDSLTVQAVHRTFEPELGICLGPADAAGQTVSVGDSVHLWRACSLGGFLEVGPDTFRAEAVETVGGMAAMRFANDVGVIAWFNPGIPYPVQVSVPAGEDHGHATLALSGYTAGSGAFPVADLGPRAAAPIPVLGPALPWGADDAGAATDFTASQAFAFARDDADWSDLRAFLAAYPEALAVHGAFMVVDVTHDRVVMEEDGGRRLSWFFDLAAGDGSDACFSFEVRRVEAKPTLLDPLAGTTHEAASLDPDCADSMGGAPAIPTAWPTAASALATWQAFAGPTESILAWSFDSGPAGGGSATLVAGPPTAVGYERWSGFSYSLGIVGCSPGLHLSGTKPTDLVTCEVAYTHSAELAGMPLPSSSAAPVTEAEDEPLPVALGAVLSPGVAAGVSVLSLAAGALYFLWPSLKGGAAGLFSRVQPNQVLEHPQRARLVQAVESEPGIHYQALLRKTGLAKGTLEHHLHALVAAGHLRRVSNGGYTCYFVGSPVVGAAAVKSEGARRLLQELQARPGQGLVEVAEASGLSPATASHHVARLEEAGLVRSLRDGRSRRLWPTSVAPAA